MQISYNIVPFPKSRGAGESSPFSALHLYEKNKRLVVTEIKIGRQ